MTPVFSFGGNNSNSRVFVHNYLTGSQVVTGYLWWNWLNGRHFDKFKWCFSILHYYPIIAYIDISGVKNSI